MRTLRARGRSTALRVRRAREATLQGAAKLGTPQGGHGAAPELVAEAAHARDREADVVPAEEGGRRAIEAAMGGGGGAAEHAPGVVAGGVAQQALRADEEGDVELVGDGRGVLTRGGLGAGGGVGVAEGGGVEARGGAGEGVVLSGPGVVCGVGGGEGGGSLDVVDGVEVREVEVAGRGVCRGRRRRGPPARMLRTER